MKFDGQEYVALTTAVKRSRPGKGKLATNFNNAPLRTEGKACVITPIRLNTKYSLVAVGFFTDGKRNHTTIPASTFARFMRVFDEMMTTVASEGCRMKSTMELYCSFGKEGGTTASYFNGCDAILKWTNSQRFFIVATDDLAVLTHRVLKSPKVMARLAEISGITHIEISAVNAERLESQSKTPEASDLMRQVLDAIGVPRRMSAKMAAKYEQLTLLDRSMEIITG